MKTEEEKVLKALEDLGQMIKEGLDEIKEDLGDTRSGIKAETVALKRELSEFEKNMNERFDRLDEVFESRRKKMIEFAKEIGADIES
ncbi:MULTISPECIES: hypothetical protein [Bacillati]|uniref:Uncharacterized protein n=3 Tax=Bacillota TaxID=1239 RepID=A0A8B5YF82_BACLI|nr:MULTISPECIES: hypothetical protein [Bacillota]EBG6512850.1 hypothetical protein [Salmonella enterica]KKB74645.1 hypothetical protein TH62_05875 [Bacillus sp. TH008]MBD8048761.1 hypothetical protein [Clostridium faecium]MCY7479041.1 hypothetical protein [Paenibacillus larvae]MCY7562517.1 hypothetical protein [Paenibacillus macerans]